MAFAFPPNPSTNQLYTFGAKTWKWNGYAWDLQGSNYAASVTSPTSPKTGDRWYKTDTDVLYEYITDGTTNYWIDIQSPTFTNNSATVNVGSVAGGITTGRAIAMSIVFGG
jgi:hypothetical protein